MYLKLALKKKTKKKQAIAKYSAQCLHITNEKKDTKNSDQSSFSTDPMAFLKI